MSAGRKIAGICVLLFVAIPMLVGFTWATGISKATMSAEFLTDLPREVIRRLPRLVEQAFQSAQKTGVVEDARARVWIQAAAKVQTSPSDMLKKIGFYAWLQNELATVIKGIGQVLRGEGTFKDIVLDNQTLKKSLSSPAFQGYIKEVMSHLPPCDAQGLQDWQRALQQRDRDEVLPACNPGAVATAQSLQQIQAELRNIPDKIQVLKVEEATVAVDLVRLTSHLLWLLFLIPALFLALGAAIAGQGARGFLRWSGGATLIGGLLPLGLSSFVESVALAALRLDPRLWDVGIPSPFWPPEVHRQFAQQLLPLVEKAVTPLVSSVSDVALVVSAVGLVLFVVSFFVRSSTPPVPLPPPSNLAAN